MESIGMKIAYFNMYKSCCSRRKMRAEKVTFNAITLCRSLFDITLQIIRFDQSMLLQPWFSLEFNLEDWIQLRYFPVSKQQHPKHLFLSLITALKLDSKIGTSSSYPHNLQVLSFSLSTFSGVSLTYSYQATNLVIIL